MGKASICIISPEIENLKMEKKNYQRNNSKKTQKTEFRRIVSRIH